MSKLKKIKSLRKKIIEKLVTEKNIEKTRKNLVIKGSVLKKCFQYAFIKPIKIKNLKTKEDLFFVKDGINIFKLAMTFFSAYFLIFYCGIFFEFALNKGVSLITIYPLTLIVIFIVGVVCSKLHFIMHNRSIIKKYNIKNINKIRENLTENFNEEEVKLLLKEKLNKKDLEEIFKSISKITDKNKIFEIFKLLKEKDEQISIYEPYVIVLIIDEIIKEMKDESELYNEENDLNTNEKILNLLVK